MSAPASNTSPGGVKDLCTPSQSHREFRWYLLFNTFYFWSSYCCLSLQWTCWCLLSTCPVSTHIWVHPCSLYFEDPARTKVNGELVAVLLTRYYESSFHLLAACPILLLQQVVLQHHHAGGVQHKPSVLQPFHYIGEHTQLSLKVSNHQFWKNHKLKKGPEIRYFFLVRDTDNLDKSSYKTLKATIKSFFPIPICQLDQFDNTLSDSFVEC